MLCFICLNTQSIIVKFFPKQNEPSSFTLKNNPVVNYISKYKTVCDTH